MRQDIAERRIGSEIQATDLRVDLANGGELPGEIDVRFDIGRFEALRKTTGLSYSIVLLEMSARTRDGESIKQGEVIEAQHLDEPWWRALGLVQIEPAVELLLREPGRAVDAGNAVMGQRGIVALGGEGDLVAQIRHAIVDRRGGEHQDAGLHTFSDDPAHQPVVASLGSLTGRTLVSEVV